MKWKQQRSARELPLDDGDWYYSRYFALVDTCHDWGVRPSSFGLCREEDDLSVMQAFTATVARMRAWEAQEAGRKQEAAPKKARSRAKG